MDTEKIIYHFQILWTKYIEIYHAEVSYQYIFIVLSFHLHMGKVPH